MTDDYPLISIVCLSMNHQSYIVQGLQSFINQSYPKIEILYLDNASTDETYELACQIKNRTDRNVQMFQRERSYNVPENFNFLIRKALGKYLCFISCDDWMEPDYITTMVDAYKKSPHVGLLYSNGWYYYQDSKTIKLAETSSFKSGNIFDIIFLKGVLFPVGYMVKREVFDDIGLYNENFPIEDYEFWLRVANKFEIGYSPKPAIYYRKHSKSTTGVNGFRNIKYYLQIAELYKNNKLFNKVTRGFRQYKIYEQLILGERKTALSLLRKDFAFERFYLSILFKILIKAKN